MIQENLSVLAYANGFTVWHYKEDVEFNKINFNSVANIMNVGDLIHMNLKNKNCSVWVKIVDTDKVVLSEK